MKLTDHQAKYLAYELTRRVPSSSLEKLSSTLSNAQVDLNPHQIEAALFAFRSPLSKGAILADEVGLGKTIEAGLVLSQKWAEQKRKILLIVPASLRKQWNAELQEKFFIPSVILEAKSFNQEIKAGNLNPFDQENMIVICSYHFARSKSPYIEQTTWDLAVIDEAHKLRNVYKTSNKIAKELKKILEPTPKILLTATPLQNSLLELYGLVSIIDEHIFGDLDSFKANYARVSKEQDINANELGLVEPRQEMFLELRERIKPVLTRTLRRQVLEYIKYTKRIPLTQDYIPTEEEETLYNEMTEYLMRPKLYALPSSQRQLMTLILRKLLASSSFAIASTLNRLSFKLGALIEQAEAKQERDQLDIDDLAADYENYEEREDEWASEEDDEGEVVKKKEPQFTVEDIVAMKQEKLDLERYRDLAKKIWTNSKGDALITALKKGFEMTAELGANKKAVIFTESTITQNYLAKLLTENGYEDKVVLFNGSNNDDKSKEIYEAWVKKYKDTDKISGSKTADKRAAIIDYFKNEGEILIATEAGAEGINLQFSSLVINYDLPWNPQRIEQRIGRCHRYGQKYDVVVINFVNRKNAADQRVFELLDQKFSLFKGVFGASDEVLGSIESGVDFEKRIASIYQTCRSEEEINTAFDTLQKEMDESIQETMSDTRQKLLENFDAEVHEKLKSNLAESKAYLDRYERWLWDISKYYLKDDAEFSDSEYSFKLNTNPFPNEFIDAGPYRIGKHVEDSHIYRPGHPLAQQILSAVKKQDFGQAKLVFDVSNAKPKVSVLEPLIGKNGVLQATKLSIEAFENEDYVLVTALEAEGEALDPDTAKKLLSVVANAEEAKISYSDLQNLKDLEATRINEHTVTISERNAEFFEHEVEKLDKWADDVKKSLELELKKLDIDIKSAKTNAKKILQLEEKVKEQRAIKDMEKKRNDMRRQLYEAQDEVEKKKEKVIDKVEAQMKQNTTLEPIFAIEWEVI